MRIPVSMLLIDLYSTIGMISYEAFERVYSNLCRTEERNYYGTILKNNFPRGNPIPHSVLNKDYLSRKYQDRHNCNKQTKICLKGLEVRLRNKEIKRKKAQREQGIKDAF